MSSLAQLINELSKQSKTLRDIQASLSQIERLDKDRSSNVAALQRQLEKVRRLVDNGASSTGVLAEVRAWLTSYEQEVEEARQEMKHRFGAELDRLLRAEGIELRGQWPELKAGLFTLEADIGSGRVTIWYGPKQERLATAALSPQDVLQRIQQLHKSLAAMPLDQPKFLKNLFEAYSRVLQRLNKSVGERVPILTVLVELCFLLQDRRFFTDPRRENFKSYSRGQFSYDLFRLHQRRFLDRELALVIATRAYTAKRQDFLWIPSDEQGEGAVYSHLYFKEVS